MTRAHRAGPLRPWGQRLLAGIASAALISGVGFVGVSPALAQDPVNGSDPVPFADAGLQACVNDKLGGGREQTAPVTLDELNTIFGLSCGSGFSVRSLDGIEHAAKITSLFFAGGGHDFSAAGSLDAAARVPKLNSLTLTDARVTDASLAGLADTPGLTSLKVTGNPDLADLSPLASLPKLSKLDLSQNPVLTDLSPIAGLDKMKDFTASQNPALSDLEPLRGLTSLTSVSVYKTAVSSLDPLSALTAVTTLSIDFTGVSSLTPLRALTKMRNLSADAAKLQSLDGIEDMTELRTLEINNNPEIGDDIGAIRNKPELTRIHMNAIGATSIEPLSGLTGLTSLQAMSNQISSLRGLPAAPATASTGAFAVTAQRIPGPEQFVPKGAKHFFHDATGQLERRDGAFPSPGGNLAPEPNPELPLMKVEVIPAWPDLEYSFADEATSNDRFTGTVVMPKTWASILSKDNATFPYSTAIWQPILFTEGFPAAEVTLSETAPAWLTASLNSGGTAGMLSGAPAAYGTWTFDIRVADALGNTLTQRFDLTIPRPGTTVFDISDDQEVLAGDTATFSLTRSNAFVDPYTGEASVRVSTDDGTALSGVHYQPVDRVLTWGAGETAAKSVEITTLALAESAGDPERALTLTLSDPTPADLTELGSGFSTDLSIISPAVVPNRMTLSSPQAVHAGVGADAETTLSFTVKRIDADDSATGSGNGWTGPASVRVVSQDATAKAETHYLPVDTEISWGTGDFEDKTVSVTVSGGLAGDPNRYFALRLTNAVTGPEPKSLPTPQLSVSSLSGVKISYPTPETTFFDAGEPQAAVAGETMSFVVSRQNAQVNPWTGEAQVRVRTVDDTAKAGTHYEAIDQTLTWASNEDGDQTVEIPTSAVPAGDPERTFTIELFDAEPAAYSALGRETAAGTILARVPQASQFSLGDDQRGKAGEPLTFTVTRADAETDPWTGEASVRVRTEDNTALAGTHFTAVDTVLTWPASAASDATQTVVVSTTELTEREPGGSFSVMLSDPSEYAELGSRHSGVGTITSASEGGDGPAVDGGTDSDTGPGADGDAGTDGGVDADGVDSGDVDAGAADADDSGKKHPTTTGDLPATGADGLPWTATVTALAGALLLGAGLLLSRSRRRSAV